MEHGGVQAGQQQDQDDEAEHRGHDANRRRLAGHLDGLHQQNQQSAERQDVVAQQVHGAGERVAAAQKCIVHLGQEDQADREADGHPDGPVEPRSVEHAAHDGRSASRQIGCSSPSTVMTPADVKSRLSRIVSYTADVTYTPACGEPLCTRYARLTAEPHMS